MINKNCLQSFFFTFHKYGIIITNLAWIFSPYVLIFYLLVILSWKINSNKCLISQIEYYLFGRTFMGEGRKYYVPKRHRYVLYINFVLGIFYYCNVFLY